MTQYMKVLNYLRLHNVANSNELRSTLHIVDVPKCVSILKEKGYTIQAVRNHDNTSTYTYNPVSVSRIGHWCYKGDNADYKMIEQKDCVCIKPEQYTIGY